MLNFIYSHVINMNIFQHEFYLPIKKTTNDAGTKLSAKMTNMDWKNATATRMFVT